MKKYLTLIGIIIAVILISIRQKNKVKRGTTITVIDRKDGPTSIFLAGKLGV